MSKHSILFITLSLIFLFCGTNHAKQGMHPNPVPISQRVFYEIFVQSFYDSNGDGIGDLNGVTSKLDYLKDLGVNGIWLLPVHPSPSYHKYDVTDYYGIHRDYGTMDDMKVLLQEAHKRDILVIIDMVINHTSSEHFFFKESRKGKDNLFRDYYVWSGDTLVQKQNPYHWHKNQKDPEKYYGFFWKGMPDLNYNHPDVRAEMKKIGKFWITEVGVDGFRLDAVKYIYPDSLVDKNVEWWQEYRTSLEGTGKDFFLVAEIWDHSDYIGAFLNRGVHSAFNFDMSFAIEMMLVDKKDPGIGDLISSIHQGYLAASDSYQDAVFLKNHDQDRIMSLLSDLRQGKLAASILLTLPGTPFLYYGEEIGMLGIKPDEYIREPMVWDAPGLDPGQTHWIDPRYSTPGKIGPVSQQLKDTGSLLSHYKAMIALRKQHPVLTNGTIKSLEGIPDHFCGYVLNSGPEEILVIHNLTNRKAKLKSDQINKDGTILYIAGKFGRRKNVLFLEPFGTLVLKYELTPSCQVPG